MLDHAHILCIIYHLFIIITQTAAFVDATDSRYGFCSKDLRKLGGSELSRIHELMSNDHGKEKYDV